MRSGVVTLYGWDLSHYDAPDSRHAVAEGFSFFTHKAGGDQDDAEYAAWWSFMEPLRNQVLLGAYWVQYPSRPIARADAFVAKLDAASPGWRDAPFILQADCEIWGGDASTKPGLTDINTFCDRLVYHAPKLRPLVYAPPWAYHDELKGLRYPLWASRYVAGSGYASVLYPGDGSDLWAPYSGQDPAILQFTSSALIAGQSTSDANAFRGTLSELTALVAPGWSQDMTTVDLTPAALAAAAQATATKFFGDYANKDSGLAKMQAASEQRIVTAISASLTQTQTALLAALQAVAAKDFVDENALAAQLGESTAAAVLAKLPADTPATVDTLTQALRNLFAELLVQPTPTPPATTTLATTTLSAALHPSAGLDTVDERTRVAREEAQRRIAGDTSE